MHICPVWACLHIDQQRDIIVLEYLLLRHTNSDEVKCRGVDTHRPNPIGHSLNSNIHCMRLNYDRVNTDCVLSVQINVLFKVMTLISTISNCELCINNSHVLLPVDMHPPPPNLHVTPGTQEVT